MRRKKYVREPFLVKRDIILRRLQKLQEYLQILRQLKRYSLQRFKSDPLFHGNAEKYLRLSMERIFDIGNHIISEYNLGKVERYQDIFHKLGNKGILPEELAQKLIPMAGMRNILVYEYLDIDLDRVFQVLHDELADIDIWVQSNNYGANGVLLIIGNNDV
ncbi:DUF86 domain-containing protein [candidate division KSB1 bacterium]|nr:DUF86 domain-containing protein [candidate division KSB1 bacterium]